MNSPDYAVEVDMKAGYVRNVKVTCKNGRVFEGFYCVYTQALDNEPEIASLTLETKEGLVEIYENEVEAIEVLK